MTRIIWQGVTNKIQTKYIIHIELSDDTYYLAR